MPPGADLRGARGIKPPYLPKIHRYPLSPFNFGMKQRRRRWEKEEEKRRKKKIVDMSPL